MADKRFEGKYGHFTPDMREYVVTDPRTPKPWANVISNGDYGLVATQTGGGYSFRGNAGQNRITRAAQDLVKDDWGRYLYLRDVESGDVWAASWKPVGAPYDAYRVRHGFGYTVYEQEHGGIRSEWTVFVPPDAPCEVWSLKLANLGSTARRLDATTWFEWILGMSPDDHREFHRLFVETAYREDLRALTARKCLWGFGDEQGRWNNVSWPYTAFLACSRVPDSHDADKESFLGRYGEERDPEGMRTERLAGRTGRFGDPGAALRVRADLAPGATDEIVFVLGAVRDGGGYPDAKAAGQAPPDRNDHPTTAPEDLETVVRRYASPEGARKALADVHAFWSGFLDAERVETPDPAFDGMVNGWLKYQAISGRLWAKTAMYQVSAGYGFRDQLQDCQVFLSCRPDLAKRQILLHAAHQFQAGDVLHWWLTIRGGGPRGTCSDDLLWLPFVVDAYLRETADEALLDVVAPFEDGGEATIYEHCKRAVEKSMSRFSPRGVPLMGDHDWNDGLSAVGTLMKGESFWVAEFLGVVLKAVTPWAEKRGDERFARKCRDVSASLVRALNDYGWDGAWYLQGTLDSGADLGTARDEEGRIFLNPQLWAVIAGMAPPDRAKSAMAAVTEHLLRAHGALLLYPAYTKVRPDIGYITRYAPGLRENGGVYTHAATWAVWAYALMGDGENAYEAFRRICPPNRHADADAYIAEPYVTPGNSDGPVSPFFGRGGWSWYTGSAQWLHRVGTERILGVRGEVEGLRIDPCLPKAWDGFRMTRVFRGATYRIEVKAKAGGGGKARALVVDGRRIEGSLAPAFKDGKEHRVEVVLA